MDAREFLNQICKLDEKMDCLEDQIDQINQCIAKISTPVSDNPGGGRSSGTSDKTGNTAIKLADLKVQLFDYLNESVILRQEAWKILKKIENPKWQMILYKRYIRNMRFSQIADEMGYTTRWISKQHRLAVAEYQRLMDIADKENGSC